MTTTNKTKLAATTDKKAKPAIVSKEECAGLIAAKMDTSLHQAKQFINAYIEVMTETLAKGESIMLVGFGTFEVRQRAERAGRNPKTGETIHIAASRVVGFKMGGQLKKAVAERDTKK